MEGAGRHEAQLWLGKFNDHHFHYGYFTFASALLAMHDPAFAADYGGMATLVAKEYANWDRKDVRFPFLRTFDIWQGHSWAGGTSSPGGENQESSSEAVQSWAGLIYLGQALNDPEMTAAGVMGYATESEATMNYWFNVGGDVFPPAWKHPITGMVWSAGKVYGTYFTGDPAWIYGIQWLPASPMLSYLVRDPAFAKNRSKTCVPITMHTNRRTPPRRPRPERNRTRRRRHRSRLLARRWKRHDRLCADVRSELGGRATRHALE